MKKGLLLLLAAVTAFFGVSVKAIADARIDSMGADVRQVEDLDLIWLYPNKVLEYKDTADFRLIGAGAGNEWGGIIKDMSDMGMGTLAAYVDRPTVLGTTASGQFTGGTGTNALVGRYFGAIGGPLGSALQAANSLDLIWGTDLSGANLGIHVGYSDQYYGAASASSDVMGLNLAAGLGFTNVGSFSQGNVYAEYDSLGGVAGGAISDIKVGTLWQNDINADNDLRLSADVELDSAKAATNNPGALAALLGIACNHKVNGGKGLINSGLFFDYLNESNVGGSTASVSSYSWVWDGGVEAQAYDWLTVRAGINKVIYNRVNGPAPVWLADDAAGGASFNTGFTINWQNFAVNTRVTTASFENVMSPNPGNGIFFNNGIGTPLLASAETDITYKF